MSVTRAVCPEIDAKQPLRNTGLEVTCVSSFSCRRTTCHIHRSTRGDSALTKEWHVSLQKRHSLLKAVSKKPKRYRIQPIYFRQFTKLFVQVQPGLPSFLLLLLSFPASAALKLRALFPTQSIHIRCDLHSPDIGSMRYERQQTSTTQNDQTRKYATATPPTSISAYVQPFCETS